MAMKKFSKLVLLLATLSQFLFGFLLFISFNPEI